MATFSGATFLEQSQGEGYPAYGAKEILVIKDKPASNTPAIYATGADIQRGSISALVTNAQLVALYDLVLETGTLVMNFESHSALLVGIAAPIRQGMEDLYSTALEFIRL